MRKLVWIAPWLALLCISCAEGGQEIAEPEVVKTADIVREDDGVTSRYYDVDNPYTVQRAMAVREDAVVRSAVEGFEALEYTCESQHSFVAEAEGPGGECLELTAVTMSRAEEQSVDIVYVLAIRSAKQSYVVPLRVSFANAPNDDSACRISEGVWISLADESLGVEACLSTAQLSLRAWLRCLAERLVAGAASCAWTCQFAPGLYLQCLAHCTAGYVIYAIFSCTFQEL